MGSQRMPYLRMNLPPKFGGLVLCAILAHPAAASADSASPERRFGFTYPSLTAPVGEVEMETRGTWKNRPGALRRFDFRHEIEMGLTPKTQLALSVANWTYDARERGSLYRDTSLEIVHNLTNPLTDLLGSALYAEAAVGDRSAGLEGKLILEKRFGKWVAGWNGALEAEWGGDRFGDFQEPAGELTQSAGIAYDLTPGISIGAELVHTLPLGKWHGPANPEVYAGPCLTFRQKYFHATLTALFQTTERTDQPAIQLRSIIGVEF